VARRFVGAVGLWVLACAVLAAADFWETKPFPMWTLKELQQVTTDSPWAKKVSVVPPPRGGGGGGGRRDGGGGGDGAEGGGGARGGGGGRGAGGGFGGGELQLLITWRSALPMKQALVRSQITEGAAVPPASQQMLDRKEDSYVITVTGVPVRMQALLGNTKMDTSLRAGKKAPLSPEEALVQPSGNEVMLVFAFPKTPGIAAEDKDVEFVTKLGQIEIKKKFTLKDMMFRGQLEM